MRTQHQLPQLPAAVAASVYYVFIASSHASAASGAGDLSRGQIVGVVIGSVGVGLLLALLACLTCCFRSARRRQTDDLSWAKTGADLEAVGIGQTPHQPLPGPCADDLASSDRRGGGDDIDVSVPGHACRTDESIVTGEGHSAGGYDGRGSALEGSASFPAFPPSPPRSPTRVGSGGRKAGGLFRGRGQGATGGGNVAQFFVVPKGLLRSSSDSSKGKDKNLQVSRSARVEPSAEVEMAEPFQPAATNMGPPLSKSSMLLRWLQGADEGLPEAAAAQLAAAAAGGDGASGLLRSDGSSGRSGGRGGGGAAAAAGIGAVRGGVRGGGGAAAGAAGMGMALDRLPLLSLAAQQTGIVWSKMPPSVASTPAVSIESASVHMLRGTLKRSDAPDDSASTYGHSHSLTHAAAALAAWHGGDDRYPASLAQAPLQSFTAAAAGSSGGGAARRDAVATGSAGGGIVFDYVRSTTSPASSRNNTAGGGAPASRTPTIGGGSVMPVSSPAGGVGELAPTNGTTTSIVAAAAAAAAATGSVSRWGLASGLPLQLQQQLGFESEDAFTVATLPDEKMLAQVPLQSHPRAPTPTSPAGQGAEAGLLLGPVGRPWLHQTPPTKLAALQEDDGEEGEDEEAVPAASAPRPSPLLQQRPSKPLSPTAATPPPPPPSPPAEEHRPRQSELAAASQPVAPGSAAAAIPGWTHFGDGDAPSSSSYLGGPAAPASRQGPGYQVPTAGNGGAAAAAGPSLFRQLLPRSANSSTNGRISPSEPAEAVAPPGGAPWVSPRGSASSTSHNLHRRVMAPLPPPLQASQSNTSFRSQSSLESPSMGVHYPELSEAFSFESSSAAAAAMQGRGSGGGGSASEAPTPRRASDGAAAAAGPAAAAGNAQSPHRAASWRRGPAISPVFPVPLDQSSSVRKSTAK